MIQEQESITGVISGSISVNAIVNNGVVVADELDPTVPSYVKEITEEDIARWNDKAEATHTHSQYLTEVPSEYVTESELNSKGYATKEELKDIDVDLTDYYTKTEIDNKGYLTQEDIGDIDVDINSISEETIEEIVNYEIVNANEVSY